jgi:sporulation protein YabP
MQSGEISAAGHGVQLENRKRMSLTGISAVESFNDREVTVRTADSVLVIGGEGLTVTKFNTDNGTLVVDGLIGSFKYQGAKTAGVFKKIFK